MDFREEVAVEQGKCVYGEISVRPLFSMVYSVLNIFRV